MIYPTRLAILAAAAGAPVAVVFALAAPGHAGLGLVWPLAVLVLGLADALPALRRAAIAVTLRVPDEAHVGEAFAATVDLRIAARGDNKGAARGDSKGAARGDSKGTARATARVQVALGVDAPLELIGADRVWAPLAAGQGEAAFSCRPARRGTARIDRVWLRWRGRLGLVWVQTTHMLDVTLPIRADGPAIVRRADWLLRRTTLAGLISQPLRGRGGDFDAFVDFAPGMDRRAVDWKRSARHGRLLAREDNAEQNAQIVFAIDCGRQMCEPVAGLPRLDEVVGAALTGGWVALKLGDKVALHAFDSRPRIASGLVSGPNAWRELRDLAARIDYSLEETNHTLGLASLSARLSRRALIVLFTEFSDVVSAELMLKGAAQLVKTHLLLVVVLRDEELEHLRDRAPEEAEDVTRAVTAAGLLRARAVVLSRLRQIGVRVIEADSGRVADRVVAAYADLKLGNLI